MSNLGLMDHWKTARKIYDKDNFACYKRSVVYVIRALARRDLYRRFFEYCDNYAPYKDMLKEHVSLNDVINRVFLFKDSTATERFVAFKNHFDLMEKYFKANFIYDLYHKTDYYDPELASEGLVLYSNEELQLLIRLAFCQGQRKEGFMTLLIEYKNEKLYNLNCRLDINSDGEEVLVIGTIQGKKNGLPDIKIVTKSMHGYRPKNLALYIARIMAETLGAKKLISVSDYGFYANSHLIRLHRLKTVYFDDFWRENKGIEDSVDKRFFVLPIEEERKSYETAKTHKRNLYRKRYALLDEIKASIVVNLKREFNETSNEY